MDKPSPKKDALKLPAGVSARLLRAHFHTIAQAAENDIGAAELADLMDTTEVIAERCLSHYTDGTLVQPEQTLQSYRHQVNNRAIETRTREDWLDPFEAACASHTATARNHHSLTRGGQTAVGRPSVIDQETRFEARHTQGVTSNVEVQLTHLFNAKKSDAQIANALGLSTTATANMRRKLRLLRHRGHHAKP